MPDRRSETTRRNNLLYRYGLTPEDYDDMVHAQDGACAICEARCPTGRRLAVDHCHKTGRVRGLLCMRCNTLIGRLESDVTRISKILAYLRR